MIYAGMNVIIKDAQEQRRTPRDVRGAWTRPKVPSKRAGRRGTRRAWKRAHPPHYPYHYREPEDVLVFNYYGLGHAAPVKTILATPAQADALRRATVHNSKIL